MTNEELKKCFSSSLAALRDTSAPDYGRRLDLARTALEAKASEDILKGINAGEYDSITPERFRALVHGKILK